MKKKYFEGYYIKLQGDEETIICIPSFHTDHKGITTAHLQIVCASFHFEFKEKNFIYKKEKERFYIKIGNNIFSNKGCKLLVQDENICLKGSFRYGPLTPLRYDIMGCFRFLPFLQCRHSVFSMYHTVEGKLRYNEKIISIVKGIGYMEGDRGHDFPKRYVWTQGFIKGRGSIMISVATVPLLGKRLPIKGFIAVVFYEGKEYRLATYCGGRIEKISNEKIILKQGNYCLVARILNGGNAEKLSAPKAGSMQRNINEKVSTKVYYSFYNKRKLLFDEVMNQASAEQEW